MQEGHRRSGNERRQLELPDHLAGLLVVGAEIVGAGPALKVAALADEEHVLGQHDARAHVEVAHGVEV